ncbi:hypothetical protein DFH09DRAFT_1276070 [Mycena vulgaris]|nr:hypothetical protein DFH09DRAFT_1276070 [Mycena vulgaris]
MSFSKEGRELRCIVRPLTTTVGTGNARCMRLCTRPRVPRVRFTPRLPALAVLLLSYPSHRPAHPAPIIYLTTWHSSPSCNCRKRTAQPTWAPRTARISTGTLRPFSAVGANASPGLDYLVHPLGHRLVQTTLTRRRSQHLRRPSPARIHGRYFKQAHTSASANPAHTAPLPPHKPVAVDASPPQHRTESAQQSANGNPQHGPGDPPRRPRAHRRAQGRLRIPRVGPVRLSPTQARAASSPSSRISIPPTHPVPFVFSRPPRDVQPCETRALAVTSFVSALPDGGRDALGFRLRIGAAVPRRQGTRAERAVTAAWRSTTSGTIRTRARRTAAREWECDALVRPAGSGSEAGGPAAYERGGPARRAASLSARELQLRAWGAAALSLASSVAREYERAIWTPRAPE